MLLLLLPSASALGQTSVRHIVVLHSYHQGLSWVDALNEGLRQGVAESPVPLDLHFEYLDTKRHGSDAYLAAMAAVLREKYGAMDIAAVVVSDNNGFEFLRRERDAVFGRVPVVFCGVNGFDPGQLRGLWGFTGVPEDVSFAENLELMRSLHPGLRRIVVYGANTATYRINRAQLLREAGQLGVADSLEFVEGLRIDSIRRHAEGLGAGDAVLLISVLHAADGTPMEFGDAAEAVSSATRVPLYGLWDFFLGRGIVGGLLVSGRAQGQAAGDLVSRLLAGEDPAALGVGRASPNAYLFDHRLLQRFGIEESSLPSGSTVLYRPADPLRRYREVFWAIGVVFLLLVSLVVLLLINGSRRRLAEIATRESERRYRELAELLPQLVFECDLEGTLEYVNDRAFQLLGYGREDLTADTRVFDFVAPEHRDAVRINMGERITLGGDGGNEYLMVRRDGSRFPCLVYALPILRDGVPVGLRGILVDISDRKQAEQERERDAARIQALYVESRRQGELYRSLLQSIPDPVALYEMDGKAVYINPSFTAVFGYTLEEVLGQRIPFVPEEEKAPSREEIRRVTAGVPCIGFETRRLTRDGRSVDVVLSSSVYHDHEGHPAGIVVILRDVTAAKRIEQSYLQAQKMEAVGTLAGGMAHDFNNLLQGILGYTQLLLLERPWPESPAGFLYRIEEAAERGAGLVRNLLAYSRREKPEPRQVDVNRVTAQALELLERTVPRMIRIETGLSAELPPVCADPVQLQQVLINLGTNARDAMPGGGTLSVSTERVTLDAAACRGHSGASPGPYVRIRVRDTGHGMDGETMGRMYEPFFTTKGVGEGTGLGLATVFGAARDWGGVLTCESVPGQGTSFELSLPVAGNPAVEAPADPAEANPGGAATGSVLVVDDDDDVREVAARFLEEKGYRVTTADSGEVALQLCRETTKGFDLVLLDLGMPGMGGERCLEELQRVAPKLRILVASGYSAHEQEGPVRALGAVGYLQKPYLMGQLSASVAAALGGEGEVGKLGSWKQAAGGP